jgi:3-dehydroquinate synthase
VNTDEVLIPALGLLEPEQEFHSLLRGSWRREVAQVASLDRCQVIVAAPVAEAHGIEGMIVPGDEAGKTGAAALDLIDRLIAGGLRRDHVLVAVGGGATTDLVGFVASVALRGVDWVAVPTTLLGCVDAAIGGKTGVNTAAGKNLVGSVHRPLAAVIDLSLRRTQPERCRREGFAELIKTGLLDPGLGAAVLAGRGAQDLEILAGAAARVKLKIVGHDPYDSGIRQTLNLGHTLGHAIETVSGARGEAVAHGDAVAMGLAPVLRLGLGRSAEPWLAALRACGLPVERPAGLDPAALVEVMRRDKKATREGLRLILPLPDGSVVRRSGVDPVALLDA